MKKQADSRVTLADVAQRVGVSSKTVSNVVNDTGWVSAPVKAKVLEAIQELGYRPNIAARQLRTGRTGLLAFGIPNLKEPYFAEFASKLVSLANKRRVSVLITQTDGSLIEERSFIEGTHLPAVDGLAISPLSLDAADLQQRKSRIPLVLLGEHGHAIATPDLLHVGIDNERAAHSATEYLITNGRRRVAAVGFQDEGSTETSRLRFQGYRAALGDASIEFRSDLVGKVDDFNRAEGSRAVDELIESGAEFDGLFCFSDSLAFGALHSLARHGISVPQDVLVIGFDDVEEGRYTFPAFATVNARADLISGIVLDALASEEQVAGGHIEVPFEIARRN